MEYDELYKFKIKNFYSQKKNQFALLIKIKKIFKKRNFASKLIIPKKKIIKNKT